MPECDQFVQGQKREAEALVFEARGLIPTERTSMKRQNDVVVRFRPRICQGSGPGVGHRVRGCKPWDQPRGQGVETLGSTRGQELRPVGPLLNEEVRVTQWNQPWSRATGPRGEQ